MSYAQVVAHRREQGNQQVILVPPDGSCYFYCLSLFLNNTKDYAIQLRHEVVEYIGSHWDEYSPFLCQENGETYKNQYDYVHKAENRSYLATHVEIQATTKLFDMSIRIYRGQDTLDFGKFDNNKIMFLLHSGDFHKGHFDLINKHVPHVNLNVTSNEQVAPLIKQAPNIPLSVTESKDEWETYSDSSGSSAVEEQKSKFYFPKKTHRPNRSQKSNNLQRLHIQNRFSIFQEDNDDTTDESAITGEVTDHSSAQCTEFAQHTRRKRRKKKRSHTPLPEKHAFPLTDDWHTVFVLKGTSMPRIPIQIDGVQYLALLDTGANYCCLSTKLAKKHKLRTCPAPIRLLPANSTDLGAKLAPKVPFQLQGLTLTSDFYVCNIKTHDAILGCEFLKAHKAILDFYTMKFHFTKDHCPTFQKSSPVNNFNSIFIQIMLKRSPF